MITVLYVCSDWYMIAGSSKSLMDLIDSVRAKVYPIVLLPQDGVVREKFQSMGVETIVRPFFYLWDKPKRLKTIIHHPSKSTLFHYLVDNRRCAKFVKKRLQGRHIDFVHSNSSITTVGFDIAKALNTKHIWHIRECLDLDFGITPYIGFNRLRKTINQADARIVISNAVAKHWHLIEINTFTVWDAVGCEKCSRQEVKPFFLFCAAILTDKKGAACAVRSFVDSKVADDGYTLKLIGRCSEEYRGYLNSLAGDYQNAIEYEGCQSDVSQYFASATGFLMCSKFEGLGRVTVEAMYQGCPVIARNSGGTTDFVINGETGYLFDSDEECAELIKYVAEGHDVSKVVENAREMVNHNFSTDVYGEKIIKIYNLVINSHAKSFRHSS